MANPPSYTFSKPVKVHEDRNFSHAVRFAELRRYAALMPELHAASPGVVRVADNDPARTEAVRAGIAAGLLSGSMSGRVLRAAGRGEGRGRNRP